jgi:hypothetical protein
MIIALPPPLKKRLGVETFGQGCYTALNYSCEWQKPTLDFKGVRIAKPKISDFF